MNRRRFLQAITILPFTKLFTQKFEIAGLNKPRDEWNTAGSTIFVTEDGDDANDGLSLKTAKHTLTAALLVCSDGSM